MGRRRRAVAVALCALAMLLAGAATLGAKPPRNGFVVTPDNLVAPIDIPDAPRAGPVPNCHRAAVKCIRTVVKRLKLREAEFGCNHRAVFMTTYRVLTQGILRALSEDPDRFRWPRYLYFEDALFANVLMANGRAWDRRARVSPAWEIAWNAAASADITATQDMLLGINAHVQNDMPFVIAALGTETRGGVSRKSDHDIFNEVPAASYDDVVGEVGRRYDAAVSLTNPGATSADNAAGLELVRRWREDVWVNANRLIDASSQAEEDRIAAEIEQNAAAWARSILLIPGTPGYRAQRDAHCAANNPDA